MKRVERLNHECKFIEDFSDVLGDTFYDAFMEEDNYTHDIGKSIVHVFHMCKTEREVEIADSMLIATCGYSIQTLMNRIEGGDE